MSTTETLTSTQYKTIIDSSYTYLDAGAEQTVYEYTTGNTIQISSIWLDLNVMTQDGTIKFYAKIDGTNYREIKQLGSSFTVASDVITELRAANTFLEIECEIDTIERRENVVIAENKTKTVTHEIEFEIHKNNSTAMIALNAMADEPCGLIAIVEDYNGTRWVSGYSETHLGDRALRVTAGASTSGKAWADTNGYTWVLSSIDDDMDMTTTDDPDSTTGV